VKATELIELLREIYRDKATQLRRHEAAARSVSDYEFNNTYQYVVAREEMHASWIRDAILDVSGTPDEVAEQDRSGIGKGDEAQRRVITEDRDAAQAFVDKWRPRIAAMTQARHRTLLNVVLGETLEHKRFFDQALAGRRDVLGRRTGGVSTGGGVLPTRWIEQ
jgi:bacterioferritin (cytochrome b1)